MMRILLLEENEKITITNLSEIRKIIFKKLLSYFFNYNLYRDI